MAARRPTLPRGTSGPSADGSNGYEAVAAEFMAHRKDSAIGVSTVRRWSRLLPRGGNVLDLGCGHGVPLAEVLVAEGFRISGVDASPTMIAAFRARFPDAPAEEGSVEDSRFFGRRFDGVIAWGLIFLLEGEAQGEVIRRVALALEPGGRFLFTAPRQECEWTDVLTGRTSRSLGSDGYRRLVESAGLILDGEEDDEGENHYFFVHMPQGSSGEPPARGTHPPRPVPASDDPFPSSAGASSAALIRVASSSRV